VHTRASELIRLLDLGPHPEGGYYRKLFRSSRPVRRVEHPVERAAMTAIYFLLVAGQQSRWHRVMSDEVWHFYEGGPLELLWLDAGISAVQRRLLGPAGEDSRPVAVVPAGCWQATRPVGAYALAGCCVAPGFAFDEFRLLADAPDDAALVRRRFPELVALL